MFDTCSFKPTNDGFPPSSGGGGGAVNSVFGRTGVVIAVAGDYNSTQITNSSGVTGAFVTDALNTLNSGKLSTTLNSAQILVGNGSNVATAVAMSGDIAISNTGATTIQNNAITTAKILNSNVTLAKIENISQDHLIGRHSSGAGTPQQVGLGTGLTMSGANLTVTGFVSETLTNTNILVGNVSNVATAVAMSGDIAISNTGATTIQNDAVTTAKILNSNVTYAKIQNVAATSLTGNSTGISGVMQDITLGTNLSFTGTTLNAAGGGGYTYLGITLSANTSYDKAALAGANYLFIRTNDATTRTITINSTGFVANDYLVLSFDINSPGIITLIMGASARTFTSNRGNTIFGVYDGTEWSLQSMANSYNTSGLNPNSLAIGLGASAVGQNISLGGGASGTGVNCVRVGFSNTGATAGVTYLGSIAAATATDCIVIGRAASNISATSGIVIGAAASITGSAGTVVGYQSTSAGGTVFGYNCSGGNTTTVCIGTNSTGTGNNTTVIGSGTTVGTNTGVVAIGQGITTTNTDAVVIGRAASAGGTANVTIGGSATGAGNNCVRIGNGVTTGTTAGVVAIGQGITAVGADAVIIGRGAGGGSTDISIGAGSVGAGGSNNIRIGQGINTTTNTNLIAIGSSQSGSCQTAIRIGNGASSVGTSFVQLGNYSRATGSANYYTILGYYGETNAKSYTIVKGNAAYARHYGVETRRLDTTTTGGDPTTLSRHNENTAWIGTTPNATPKILTLFDVAGERLTLQDNEALHFDIMITAKQNGSTNTLVRRIAGGAVRGSGVGTTTIVGQTTLYTHGTALTTTVSADTTNGAVAIEVTGNANTWQWTALVNYQRTRTA